MHPQKLSFVFVSTNHKIKGLPLLLNIFKELDPEKYELIVLGDRIKQEVSDHVIYLGYQTELYEIYAAADLLIHPSIYEAFGQIVTESLQSGTPVIISNMVGAKEVIKNHEGLIISSFDAKDWVNQITGLEKSQFRLSPTISEDKGLSISQHIDKMLIIWQENKSL